MSTTPRIFISYSHDSDKHGAQVLALSERLRSDGFQTLLDQYVNGSPQQGWPRWMLDQLDTADFVLVVCSKAYYRRFRGHEEPGKGKGGDWEGALITQEIYNARSKTLKFVPVFLSAAFENWIPEPLRSGNHYVLTSASAYKCLCDFLVGVAGVEPCAVGPLKNRERQKGAPLTFEDEAEVTASERRVDISRIVKYAPSDLIGREEETRLLDEAWTKVRSGESKRPRILTFVALGGEGKTSLVAKWAAELAHQEWPGCNAAFAWSFYSQGTREQMAASSDHFLKEALTFFGDDADKAFAIGPAGAYEKGQRLARIVGGQRSLLILDGLEPLQYAPTPPTPGQLKDQGIAALLKGLATISHGLCIVTTRYSLPDLRAFWRTTALEVKLLRLSRGAGVYLLQSLGVKGSLLRNIPLGDSREQVNEFEKLVEDVQGHALTLNLLGGYLKRAFKGDIRQRDRVNFEKADEKIQGGHAFRAMAAYAAWMEECEDSRRELAILQLLGLFDRPASADCVAVLRRAPVISGLTELLVDLSEEDWEFSLTGLEEAGLLTVAQESTSDGFVTIDAHPLLREYFAKCLREQPDAWSAAHRRLYEHICATTHEGDRPTLSDLEPLYQAVVHGCQAGLYDNAYESVYYRRILRGNQCYSWHELGAFGAEIGAQACFFEIPWSRVYRTIRCVTRLSILSEVAIILRALGRLSEAREPMRAGLKSTFEEREYGNAAAFATNLSELEVVIGEITAAKQNAERAVEYADRSSNAHLIVLSRTIFADALHQAGYGNAAKTLFEKIEGMQNRRQDDFAPLYPISGFQKYDMLLATAERAAWQVFLTSSRILPSLDLIALCQVVYRSVEKDLRQLAKEGVNTLLLTTAMSRLALGRAAFYQAAFKETSFDHSYSLLQQAASDFLKAADMTHLPRGLLSRAWVRYVAGERVGQESAQTDLDEAWGIAERGPMRLHMADIHLYRARLFFREAEYPWESPQADLTAAEKLINECGYHRRDGELNDAKEAILGGRK